MTERSDNVGYGAWSETGVGTSSGVTVTHALAAGKKHVVTGIQCSGDAAAIVTVESPSGTKLFSKRFAAAFNFSERFDTPLLAARDAAVLVKVSASSSNSEANIQGYTVR